MEDNTQERRKCGEVSKKAQAIIYRIFPIISWLPRYNRGWLFGDFIAGITIGIMVVPQALSYALIANLPVQYGLYTATFSAILYCLFGTSKDINVGPITMLSLLTGQVALRIANTYGYSTQEVAITMAFMSGIILLILGILRLGILLDFISAPVSIGFTTGAALSIMSTQIPSLLGVKGIDTERMPIIIIIESCKSLPHSQWVDLILGILAIIVLASLNYIKTRFGYRYFILRFLGTARNAIVIVIFTLVSLTIKRLDDQSKVTIIGDVPRGLQPPEIPNLNGQLLREIGASSGIAVLLGLMEHFGVCKSMGRKNKYTTDNNQELLGLGVCNIIGSIFSGYCASGSFSRGAVNAQSNVKTPLSGVLTGVIAIFSLLFLPSAFYYIPQASLSAIILVSMTGLVSSPRVFWHIWKIDKTDFMASVIGALITLFVKIETGILMAIGCSIIVLLYRLARPRVMFPLGVDQVEIFGGEHSGDVSRGVVMVRLQESLLFPNVEYFRRKTMRNIARCTRSIDTVPGELNWCDCKAETRDSGNRDLTTLPYLKAVIFDMTLVNQIDYSGVQCILEIKSELERYVEVDEVENSVQIYYVGVNPTVHKKLQSADLIAEEAPILAKAINGIELKGLEATKLRKNDDSLNDVPSVAISIDFINQPVSNS
ncbi:hypothetical protein K7432_013255 [Basidiobolus ranarum]|uniref:STAS domain-containing protein n=1 Tax=Basidiobolus ranarum TaxID=34480 RepID=A0ABR2VR51_9FUNG